MKSPALSTSQTTPEKSRILLVDDSPENLTALEAILESLGQELVKANSGLEALRHLLDNDFALILLDVKMPEMDGFETAALIRARKRSQNTPILFLTGYRNEEHLFRGYDLGAVDFLFKPLVPEILQSKVSVFVELSRNSDRLKKQASDLRKAEQRFRTLLETAPDAIVIIDHRGEVSLVNTRAEQLFGKPRSELIGRSVDPLLPDWQVTFSESGSASVETRANHPDAGAFPVEVTFSPLKTDEGSICICAIRDITERKKVEENIRLLNASLEQKVAERTRELMEDVQERKRTEQALRESEQRLRVAIEAAQMGVWNLDLRTRTMTVSDRMARLLGFESVECVLGFEQWISHVHADDRERVISELEEVASSGTQYESEYRVAFEQTEPVWISSRGQVLTKELGLPQTLSGVAQDVSDRRQSEEVFRHKQKLESLGILAGGIAHDFNNLLTGVLGNASLLAEEVEPGSSQEETVNNLIRAGERAAELTNQMLAYSGRGRFVIEPIRLSEHIQENLVLLRASLPRNVKLELSVQDDLPPIEADSSQLQQLVMNLVINGAEAIDEMGSVHISTASKEFDASSLKQLFPTYELTAGSYVVLEVVDTGHGMSEATQGRIFEPFYTTKFTGRGLGLAAVQGIVRGHKGGIRVSSRISEGTSFQVIFPVTHALSHSRKPNYRTTDQSLLGKGTILIVDDEEIVRRFARAGLQMFGYETLTAKDGREGIDVFRANKEKISAVLLDMTMPSMSGEQALPEIRKIRSDVPVIASSGYSEVQARMQFGTSISHFIQKPYTTQKLAEVVQMVLNPHLELAE